MVDVIKRICASGCVGMIQKAVGIFAIKRLIDRLCIDAASAA
jgi:hypothetical protein